MVKTIYWNQHTKKNRSTKNNDKDGKALYKSMNNAIYGKTTENLRNRISIQLVSNEKDNLKSTSKRSYMSHKIFDNNLVATRKSKLALKPNKPAYIGMCILELSKVLMYRFHYDYIKKKYDSKSKLLITDTESLMYELKTGDIYEDVGGNKEMFDFSNYSTKSKYYSKNNSNKLVIGKMKDETRGIAIEEIVWLKPKIYSFLVDNSEHKKALNVNKHVVATISHNVYKDVLLNNECIRHSMNRIQSKD